MKNPSVSEAALCYFKFGLLIDFASLGGILCLGGSSSNPILAAILLKNPAEAFPAGTKVRLKKRKKQPA